MARKRSDGGELAEVAAQPGFVFRGTVLRPNASSVPEIKSDGSTAVVRVDEVIEAPPALARFAGREVTVVTGQGAAGGGGRSSRGGRAMGAGQQAVFYTHGLRFGDTVAVRAVKSEPLAGAGNAGGVAATRAAAAPLPAEAGAAQDPVAAHRDRQLKQSLDDSDVVVAGTVTAVRMAPETRAMAAPAGVRAAGAGGAAAGLRGAAAGAAVAPARTERISEHDPLWHEAVVQVHTVEKGAANQKEVVVRFPGSNDVRWRNHPKFRAGQQGVFMLKKGGAAGQTVPVTSAAAVRRGVAGAAPATAEAALQATASVQPISAIEKVRQLLARPRASGPAPARPRRGGGGGGGGRRSPGK